MPKLSITRAKTVHHRLSDAQIEGKVSVTLKSRLARNNKKTYYNNFAASAVLACGQPSQEAPKNTNQLMDNFYALSRTLIEKCSFHVSREFSAKLGAIDQLGFGYRPVDRDRLVGHL